MKSRSRNTLFSAVGFMLLASAAFAQTSYRIVDDNGVVHIVQRVTPELARYDREVLNSQGIVIGREEGEITEEEREEMARVEAEETAVRQAREAAARRDRVLLDTYLTVEDIRKRRDNAHELFEGQIKVAEHYLDNLNRNLSRLEDTAARFRNSEQGSVPPNVAYDIQSTRSSIEMYETNLASLRAQQRRAAEDFQADIERFIELRGADASN